MFNSTIIAILVVLFGIIWFFLRHVTLGGLMIIGISPFITALLGYPTHDVINREHCIVLLIIIAHRENIADLIDNPTQQW